VKEGGVYSYFFVKNQLVAHPQVKLRVVSRNTNKLEQTELVDTQLNAIARDLSEIARLIEESSQSSVPVLSQSKLKTKA
jgi:hypothetical protein